MAANKRTEIQREKDLVRIADLYCRGVYQADIAAQLGVTRHQVGYDLNDLRGRWLAASVEKIDQRKADELARLDNLERIAWAAWERSCLDAEINHVKTVRGKTNDDGAKLPPIETLEKTTKGQVGDPRFLERVGWCINKRCELLGLDAPKKLDHTSGGEPFYKLYGFDPDKEADSGAENGAAPAE